MVVVASLLLCWVGARPRPGGEVLLSGADEELLELRRSDWRAPPRDDGPADPGTVLTRALMTPGAGAGAPG